MIKSLFRVNPSKNIAALTEAVLCLMTVERVIKWMIMITLLN